MHYKFPFLTQVLKPFLVLLIFILIVNIVHSQNYPIELQWQITPPYPRYLSDYVSNSDRIEIQIRLKDKSLQQLSVKLHLKISDEKGILLKTISDIEIEPLTLKPNEKLFLSIREIEPYFDISNVSIIRNNLSDLVLSGELPEGILTFSMQVYEFRRNLPISNEVKTKIWLFLSEPPKWVNPKGDKRFSSEKQDIKFEWKHGNVSTLNAELNPAYEFYLVELINNCSSPVELIKKNKIIYQTTTKKNTLHYNKRKPLLKNGGSYAAIIRAYHTGGGELYKNNGYSKILTFRFNGNTD